jgi:hypothetical protein
MDPPQNHIWGPPLWRILHSLTERIGNISPRQSIKEEQRLWFTLLNIIKLTLPCPLCKKHYIEYFKNNIPDRFINISKNLKDDMRIWLYTLHSQVNERLNKGVTINISDLPTIYGGYSNWMNDLTIISTQMKKGVTVNLIAKDDMIRIIKLIREIMSFYGV